jgi:hypothetical protein
MQKKGKRKTTTRACGKAASGACGKREDRDYAAASASQQITNSSEETTS